MENDKPGMKFGQEKPRYDLIPPECLEEIANVLAAGAIKYSDNNWQKAIKNPEFRKHYERAMMGHINEWRKGKELDTESGVHHLAHAICCCMFFMWDDFQVLGGRGDAEKERARA